MPMHCVSSWSPGRPEECILSPETDVVGCKPPCGFWESIPGPLEDQQVLLTTEPCAPDSHIVRDKYDPSFPFSPAIATSSVIFVFCDKALVPGQHMEEVFVFFFLMFFEIVMRP